MWVESFNAHLDADKDGDKKLSCQEVKKYLKYGDILGCNGGEEQNWFKHLDLNNDGFLEGNEIDEDYQNPKSPNNQASFESVFFYHEKRVNSFNEGLNTMAINAIDNDEIEEFSHLGYDTTALGFGKCLTCAAKIMKAVYKCRHDSHKLKCVRDFIALLRPTVFIAFYQNYFPYTPTKNTTRDGGSTMV